MQVIDRAIAKLSSRSLESDGTPLTASNIFSILGGAGITSASGMEVSRDSALGHPAIFRGVSLIANDVSKLPIHIYRRFEEGGRERFDNHPASRLLRKRANPWLKSHTLLKTLVGHAMLHRGGYARIFRNGAGTPTAMDLLDPEHTWPVVAGNELFYQTRLNGRDFLLLGQDVFHIRGLGFDGLDGWSVIDKLKDAIGLGLAAQKYGAVYFKNNAQPRVVIKFPGYLGDEEAVERFRASWGSVHSGVDNSHKPAILEGGAEVTPFSINNQDSQFLELRQFDVRMVAAILGVPPHKLGDATRTSFASLEQENQSYLDEAIDPWLREIETEAADKLLTSTEYMNDSAFVEFNRSALIRTNLTDRFTAYNTAIMAGFMSRQEVRKKENLNDVDGLDQFLVPLNMGVGAGAPAVEEDDEEVEESNDDRLRAAATHTAERMLQRLLKGAERAARANKSFLDWLDGDLDKTNRSVLVDSFQPFSDRADGIAGELIQVIHGELLDAAGRVSTGEELEEEIRRFASTYVVDGLPSLVGKLLRR